MQGLIRGKVLSLFLAALLILSVFAGVEIAIPKAYAADDVTVGDHTISFDTATSGVTDGSTATINGVTANVEIEARGRNMAYARIYFSGTPALSGQLSYTLTGDSATGMPVSMDDYSFVNQNTTINPLDSYPRWNLNLDRYGDISNLRISLTFNEVAVYKCSGNEVNINGQTLKYDHNFLWPYVGEGELVYPTIFMDGDPTAAGTYTATLSSEILSYSETVTFVAEYGFSEEWISEFEMPARDVDDFVISVTFTPSNSKSDSGSSSSGGGGSSRDITPSTSAPAPVNTATAVKDIKDAVAAAKNSSGGATVKLQNVTTVSLSTMKEMAKAAANTDLKVNADSLNDDGSIDVRITIDPSQATRDINLSASTNSIEAKIAEMKFAKHFNNTISAVSLSQKGSFGMPVKVAAKVDPKLNKDTLVFYSYDSETNSFRKIENPQYKVDKNGYVHFTTSVGGEIIISDKPLTKKK